MLKVYINRGMWSFAYCTGKDKPLIWTLLRITLDLKSEMSFEDQYHHPPKQSTPMLVFLQRKLANPPPPIRVNFNVKVFWSWFCLGFFVFGWLIGFVLGFLAFFSVASGILFFAFNLTRLQAQL